MVSAETASFCFFSVVDAGRRPGLLDGLGECSVGVGHVLEGLRVGLLDVRRSVVVRGGLLDRGVGRVDLRVLGRQRVADLLGPGVELLVAVVAAAASGQRQYQYRTAGHHGRELLVHRVGPFHGSRPRNIHGNRARTPERMSAMSIIEAICTRREKAHGSGTYSTQRAGDATTRVTRPPLELGPGGLVYEITAGSADLDEESALSSSPTAIPRRLEMYTATTMTASARTAIRIRTPMLLSSP